MLLIITRGQRIFFAVICAAALLVAILGLFNPAYLASIFTWLELPPLHARFVGAIYAFGAVFMAGCLAARYQAEVCWGVQLIGIWTGMLFIISLLNLNAFDFSLLPVQIWFASYIIYPVISLWMTIQQPHLMKDGDLPGPNLASWAKRLSAHSRDSLLSAGSAPVPCSGLYDDCLALESNSRFGTNVRGSAFIVRIGKPVIFAPGQVAGCALHFARDADFHSHDRRRFLFTCQPLFLQ